MTKNTDDALLAGHLHGIRMTMYSVASQLRDATDASAEGQDVWLAKAEHSIKSAITSVSSAYERLTEDE